MIYCNEKGEGCPAGYLCGGADCLICEDIREKISVIYCNSQGEGCPDGYQCQIQTDKYGVCEESASGGDGKDEAIYCDGQGEGCPGGYQCQIQTDEYGICEESASDGKDATTCPTGLVCEDGECSIPPACTDGTLIVGSWTDDDGDGQYDLVACPAGYQKQIASFDTQQCHACLSPAQYIIDPNNDICQNCPPGLTCQGDATVVPVLEGSTWTVEDNVFKLVACPTGYSRRSIDDGTVAEQQHCVPAAETKTHFADTSDPPTSTSRPLPGQNGGVVW